MKFLSSGCSLLKSQLTFRTNMSPSPSASKTSQERNQCRNRWHEFAWLTDLYFSATRIMVLGWTQLLTEMSIRNLPVVTPGQSVRLITLPPSVSRLSRKCAGLNTSHLWTSTTCYIDSYIFFFLILFFDTEDSAICSSEKSVSCQRTIWCYISEITIN
jgi:hypothetical protein